MMCAKPSLLRCVVCVFSFSGLVQAQVPNTNGLQLVDNAGTGATEGPIAEASASC